MLNDNCSDTCRLVPILLLGLAMHASEPLRAQDQPTSPPETLAPDTLAPETSTHSASTNEDASSLLSAYLTNLESMRQYDVISRYQEQFAGDAGTVLETQTIARQVLDLDQNRGYAVCSVSRDRLEKSPTGSTPVRTQGTVAGVCTGTEGWVRNLASPKADRIKNTLDDTLFWLSDVPNIGFIGVIEHRVVIPHVLGGKQIRDRLYTSIRSGARPYVLQSGNVVMSPLNDMGMQYFVTMDRQRLVPVSQRRMYTDENGKVSENHLEHYEFQEIDGIYVPIHVVGQHKAASRVDGIIEYGVTHYELELRWFSVNESLSEDQYNLELLNDENKITSLINPDLLTKHAESIDVKRP